MNNRIVIFEIFIKKFFYEDLMDGIFIRNEGKNFVNVMQI